MLPALPQCLPGSRRPVVGRTGSRVWTHGPRRRPWRRPSEPGSSTIAMSSARHQPETASPRSFAAPSICSTTRRAA